MLFCAQNAIHECTKRFLGWRTTVASIALSVNRTKRLQLFRTNWGFRRSPLKY
jgi:hypothetical protein